MGESWFAMVFEIYRPDRAASGGRYVQLKIECGCCFAECDPKDMLACPIKHAFCIACLQKYAATQLGDHKPEITCMHGSGCKVPFHRSTLQLALPEKLFKLYERQLQQKELREANIENLEYCPRCDFAMIMEVSPEQEPLFECLNVEEGCGKATCRTCKRDNHSPRTCREEELASTGPEHAVQEAMSEALMRRCPGCDRATVKETGCNRIVCPDCDTHFCYTCRNDISDEGYDHFHRNVEHDPRTSAGANGKCLLWDEVLLEQQHEREVRIARERATALQQERGRPVPAVGVPPAPQVDTALPLVQQAQALFQRLFDLGFRPVAQPAPLPDRHVHREAQHIEVEDEYDDDTDEEDDSEFEDRDDEEEEEVQDFLPLRRSVEAAYTELRGAYTALFRVHDRHPQRPARLRSLAACKQQVLEADRQYEATKVLLVQHRRGGGAPRDFGRDRDEASRLVEELNKAQNRERNAKKQWEKRDEKWPEERYRAYLTETERYRRLLRDAEMGLGRQ
ncbi:hypothetical protein NMY22_g11965 [Coprinellus aureogranulatus]|nr:hypothetical protein NMY22_g11965 [Coprinellus aureogranulatus]